jgi:hypothetical protein
MVPGEPPRTCGRTAADPQRQAPRLLPILRTLPTNSRSIWKFYRAVCRIWRKWLNRRTRGKRLPWEKYTELLRRHPFCFLEEPAAWKSAWWICEGRALVLPRSPKRARSWKRRIAKGDLQRAEFSSTRMQSFEGWKSCLRPSQKECRTTKERSVGSFRAERGIRVRNRLSVRTRGTF